MVIALDYILAVHNSWRYSAHVTHVCTSVHCDSSNIISVDAQLKNVKCYCLISSNEKFLRIQVPRARTSISSPEMLVRLAINQCYVCLISCI